MRKEGRLDRIFKKVVRMGLEGRERDDVKKLLDMEPFDLIVMNPPFSRTTGRGRKSGGGLFGFMGDKDVRDKVKRDFENLRNEIQDDMQFTASKLLQGTNLQMIFRDPELRAFKNIWQAGEGLLFIYLADIHLKTGGKLCFVLPRGLLTGVSWFLARTLLASKYHVEYVLVSYEADAYNFSKSTSLSECMIIAKGEQNHTSSEKTNFVILLKKPKTSIEAIALSNEIEAKRANFVEAGDSKAFVIRVERHELLENIDNWGRFIFLPEIKILEGIENILHGTLMVGRSQVKIPLIRLNEIMSSIGVDRHRFMDTFQNVDESVPGTLKMLKGGKEEQRKTLRTSSNAFVLPIIERGKNIFDKIGGTLLIPDRIRINTAHVISMICDEKVISNIFYIIRLKNETPEKLKALCVWLNTTWGILTVLASREETHGGFIQLKMSQWKLLPVLNVNTLPRGKLRALASIFEKFRDAPFLRIPEQYGSTGKIDKLRLELDLSFLNIMGMEIEETDLLSLYEEIGQSLVQWIGN